MDVISGFWSLPKPTLEISSGTRTRIKLTQLEFSLVHLNSGAGGLRKFEFACPP